MCDLARVHMSDSRVGEGGRCVGDALPVSESVPVSVPESESGVGLSVCAHWASWIWVACKAYCC